MAVSFFRTVRNSVNYCWLIMLAGIILAGIGFWVITSPVGSCLYLSIFISMSITVTGLFEIIFSLNNKTMTGYWWNLIGGAVDLILGLYLFNYPVVTMIILPLLVGFCILFRGAMAIAKTFELRSYGMHHWSWFLLTGVLMMVLGAALIANPAFGAAVIVIWMGLAFILSGILRIYPSIILLKVRYMYKPIDESNPGV